MFAIDEKNGITITRGDSGGFTLALTEGDQPYDFSGDTVKFGVKRSVFDQECVLKKTVDSETGKVEFEPDDTKNLEFGDYLYDIEVTHVDDSGEEPVTSVYTPIAAARFTVGWNVL